MWTHSTFNQHFKSGGWIWCTSENLAWIHNSRAGQRSLLNRSRMNFRSWWRVRMEGWSIYVNSLTPNWSRTGQSDPFLIGGVKAFKVSFCFPFGKGGGGMLAMSTPLVTAKMEIQIKILPFVTKLPSCNVQFLENYLPWPVRCSTRRFGRVSALSCVK